MYSINLRQLETEMKRLKEAIFWSGSCYWSTRPPGVKRKKDNTNVRTVYLKKFNWCAFVFSKLHRQSLAVFQNLPTYDAYFYKETINRGTNFAGWCIDAKHFEQVLGELKAFSDVEVEFVIKNQDHNELVFPALFAGRGLEFYLRGAPQSVGNKLVPEVLKPSLRSTQN